MSQSILKQCLQLVEDDLLVSSSSKQTKKAAKKKSKNGSIFDMIPEQKRLTITTKGKNQMKRKLRESFLRF